MHALCNLVGRTFLMVTLIIIIALSLCNLVGRTYLKGTLIIIIALSLCNLVGRTYLAPVVQKVDSAMHWINLYPSIAQLISCILIHWIVIFPVDSTIQLLNNWDLMVTLIISLHLLSVTSWVENT